MSIATPGEYYLLSAAQWQQQFRGLKCGIAVPLTMQSSGEVRRANLASTPPGKRSVKIWVPQSTAWHRNRRATINN
jgi:hypothetical protein